MIFTERIDFRRVRDFSEIFNAAFTFTQQHFKTLGKAVLFIAGPVVLIEGVLAGMAEAEKLITPESFFSSTFWAQYAVVYLAMLVAMVLVTGVVYEYVLLYLKDPQREITVEAVWQALREDFWMLFWTMLGAGFLYIIGFLLCLVPGVYLMVTLAPIMLARLHERLDFNEAMTRCRYLVKDYWWTGFGLILVSTLIVYAVIFVFQLPQVVLTFLIALNAVPEMSESLTRPVFMLATVLASFAGLLAYAFPTLVVSFYYFNLIERKEARGLMEKIDQIA